MLFDDEMTVRKIDAEKTRSPMSPSAMEGGRGGSARRLQALQNEMEALQRGGQCETAI